MPRARRRKRAIAESDSENEDCTLVTRRSSLRVNLSFTSNLSDTGESGTEHESLRKTAAKNDETSEEQHEDLVRTRKRRSTKSTISNDTSTPVSVANVTVIDTAVSIVGKNILSKSPKHSVLSMKEKEQQLNKSTVELKNAIISKTQCLLDNQLIKKTSKILAGCSSPLTRIVDKNHEDRSSSFRIDIGKNDQLVTADGHGNKQNSVQMNPMSENIPSENTDNGKASQNSDRDGSDCSQSIASTPKKSNIETSVDKSTGRTSKQIIRIPIARLFADNNPDNSMSEINPVPITENLKLNSSKEHEANSNISKIFNELNNTVSPILSQGTRKTRISRLSLKRKLTTYETGSSRVSTGNESFINRPPITCSSFIERLEQTCDKSNLDQRTSAIILQEKNESNENQKTINLDDNENNTSTVNIDHSSSQSSMEITTISARTPIIRKSFQQLIRQSFKFDTADIPGNKTQKSTASNSKFTNVNGSSIKKAHKSISANIESKNVCPDDCSVNTVRTSLNVNTSLDDVSLAKRVMQRENRSPRNVKQLVDQISKSNIVKKGKKLTTIRSSLCVNTSLDSVNKSSESSTADLEQEKSESAQLQAIICDSNQEKVETAEKRANQPSNGTVRSSMQVNTSLDSIQKSPNTREPLNYNKILSMVEEASSIHNSEVFDDSERENVSLLERIQINSALKNKKTVNKQNSSKEMILETSKGKNKLDSKRKSNKPESSCTTENSKVAEKNELERKRKSNEIENNNVQESDSKNSESNVRRKSSRKSKTNSTRKDSMDNKNVSESSVVEATPFPASRSLLFKTIIKNNIAMNTLNLRKLVDSSDDDENDEIHPTLSKKPNSFSKKDHKIHENKSKLGDDSFDTVIVNSSDESSNESNKEKEDVIIDESLNDTGNQNSFKMNKSRKSNKQRESRVDDSSREEEEKRNVAIKRKLYPLRENSQISFSPTEMTEAPRESVKKDVKMKKRRKMIQKKQENVEVVSPEPTENYDYAQNVQKPEKKKKKPRKIKSKKIVVKKVTNLTMLDNMLENNEEVCLANDRSSLREFDLRKVRDDARKERNSVNHKIVIVVTGLEKDDKDLVKNVVKNLGSALLQASVTPRTTHVISSGVRTINLLKGIIRGCWLLTLEWVLKSLERGKWLDPSPYEMSHFSKAVQVNRRDRKLFGKGYVPELFITCGPMYIENGTTPPASTLKELVKTAGGRIIEDPNTAKIIVGLEGLKENWILDSITTGEIQPFDQYKRN